MSPLHLSPSPCLHPCMWNVNSVSSDVSEFDPIEIFNKRCHMIAGKMLKVTTWKKGFIQVRNRNKFELELFWNVSSAQPLSTYISDKNYWLNLMGILKRKIFWTDSKYFLPPDDKSLKRICCCEVGCRELSWCHVIIVIMSYSGYDNVTMFTVSTITTATSFYQSQSPPPTQYKSHFFLLKSRKLIALSQSHVKQF